MKITQLKRYKIFKNFHKSIGNQMSLYKMWESKIHGYRHLMEDTAVSGMHITVFDTTEKLGQGVAVPAAKRLVERLRK